MDIFGSNATPMGGATGRTDAVVGATEAQQLEGDLHLHFFMYPQQAHQHQSLHEIGERLRQGIIAVSSLKERSAS